MSQTTKTKSQLIAEFPDNLLKEITAQRGRDLIVTAIAFPFFSDPMANNDRVDSAGIGAFFDGGQWWYNSSTGAVWFCLDGTPTVAQWRKVYPQSGAGGVTSVGLAAPSDLFGVSGSPVTNVGTLTLTKANASPNLVYAGPVSGVGLPTFRALVYADLPPAVTSVGLTMPSDTFAVSGSPVTGAGSIAVTKLAQLHGLFFASDSNLDGLQPFWRRLNATDVTSTGSPAWILIDVDYTQFNAAGPGSQTLNFAVTSNTHFHCCLVRHTQIWQDAPVTPNTSMSIGFNGGAAPPPGQVAGVGVYYSGNLPQVNPDNTARNTWVDYLDVVNGTGSSNPNPAGWTVQVEAVHNVASLWTSGHTRIAFLYSHPPF